MRCENCGTELPDGARFCYMCASPVGEAAEPEAVDGGAVAVEGEGVEVVKADEPAQTTGEAADAAEPVAADDVTGDEAADAEPADAPAEAESEAPGAVSAPAGQDADDDVPVAPVDFGSMPTPVKLEDPLSVGAVPFVPMAPAPRSTYVQRRVSHQPRNARPGTNSAPTTATGYNGGWPQNSAWSLQDRPAESAAPAAAGDASAENPIDNVKSKFSKALGSWTATSAARSEKKRQEKEIKEAARRVQEQERAEARDAEDRARRAAAAKAAREEKERLEREALAAAHPAAEEDAADNERQVDVVVDAVDAVAAEPAAPASAEADQAAADITEPADADLAAADAAQAADAVAAADPALAESADAEPEDSADPAFPEFDDASSTAVMKPVSAPAADSAPATEQAGDTGVFSEDVSTFWLDDDVAADDEPATNDFAAAPYGASGRAPYSSSRATGRNNKTLVAAVLAGLAVVLIAVGAFAAFSGSSSSKETPQLKPETEVTMPGQEEETEEEAEPEEEQTVVAVKASVNDYSWSDLSKISSLISAATSRTEAVGIAQKYNLCSTTGTLDGTQTKTITLTDGTTVNMRIVGFWQDLKSDGTGHAGISMLADSVVSVRAMNDSADGADWSATSLRSWLNGEFIDELPDELKECLVSVSKQTNRYSASAEQEATDDKVWLVSYSELVGDLGSGSYRAGSYNSEGDQYQLFSDQGVSWDAASSYLQVGGDCVNWWTRSTDTVNADRYIAPRNEDGYAGYSRNPVVSGEVGVVPGFCL